jgi:hypothetical protein
MSDSSTTLRQLKTQDIEREQWIRFLADFTKQNRGAHAILEILGIDEIKHGVETEDRHFSGVSVDAKDGESTVWITLGDVPDRHLTHGIYNVTVIREIPPTEKQGAVLEVETADGTRTILQLTRPEAFALPPAT